MDRSAVPLRFPRLERIIAAWRVAGARVVLSFPPLPKGSRELHPVSPSWLEKFRDWAERQGASVISTPEAHLFPVTCFFDSPYHLHSGCTKANTDVYARAVTPFLQ